MRSNWWTTFLGRRYLGRSGDSRGDASVRLSILGIGAGVMTLIAVLSVMNGFQGSTIENILEVSSFHLRVEAPDLDELPQERVEELRELPNVVSVVPFADLQALARGFFQRPATVLLRAVPPELPQFDPGMAEQLEIVEGSFDLDRPRGVVIGSELSRSLGAGVGEAISLVHLPESAAEARRPEETQMVVTGVFRTGYLDFDRSWAFISHANALEEFGIQTDILGIKLRNRYQERATVDRIRELLPAGATGQTEVISWRTFNRGIFGALRVEKSMMLLLVGLIFLVVAVNIFHTLNRSVVERQEEIALLRAIGATPKEVTSVFLGQGIMIGFAGATAGLLLGLLISVNINGVFEAAELIINLVLGFLARLTSGFGAAPGVEIFSSRDFYLAEVPVEIRLSEAILVYLFAVLSSTLAGYAASRRVSTVSPSTILREEVNG